MQEWWPHQISHHSGKHATQAPHIQGIVIILQVNKKFWTFEVSDMWEFYKQDKFTELNTSNKQKKKKKATCLNRRRKWIYSLINFMMNIYSAYVHLLSKKKLLTRKGYFMTCRSDSKSTKNLIQLYSIPWIKWHKRDSHAHREG